LEGEGGNLRGLLRGKYRRRKLTGANFRGENFFGGVNSRMGNIGGG